MIECQRSATALWTAMPHDKTFNYAEERRLFYVGATRARIALHPDGGGTRVTMDLGYRLRFGALGALILIERIATVGGRLTVYTVLLTGAIFNAFSAAAIYLIQSLAYIKEMSIGLAIILFLIFEPEGLAHRWKRIKAYWKLYPFSY